MSDISINSSSTHVCQSFQTDLNGNDVSDTESATEGYSIFRADSKRGRGCVIFTCGNAHLDCPLRYHSCTFLRCTVDPNPAARDRFPSSRCGLPLTLEYFVIQPIPHKNPSATLLQLPHHLLLVREFNALKACWMELQRAGFSGHFAAALTRALGLGMSSNPPDTAQANYNSSWIGGPNYFSKSRLQEREDELPYRKMRNRCKSEIRQCNTRRQATIIDFARKNNNVLFKYMGHRRRKEPTAFSSTTDYTVNNSVRAPESRMRNNIRSDKESGDSRAARIDGETMLYQANKIRNGEIQCYELLRLNSKFYSYDVSENSSVFRSICSLAYVRFAVSYFKFLFGLQQSKLDRYLLKEMPGLPNTKVEESHFDKKCHSYTTVADGHEVNFSITQDSCGFDLRDRGPKAFAIQPKTDLSSNTLLFANDGDCTRAPRKLLGTTDQYVSSSGKMHIHTTGSNAANPVLQTFAVLALINPVVSVSKVFREDERRKRQMKDAACNVHLNDKIIQVKAGLNPIDETERATRRTVQSNLISGVSRQFSALVIEDEMDSTIPSDINVLADPDATRVPYLAVEPCGARSSSVTTGHVQWRVFKSDRKAASYRWSLRELYQLQDCVVSKSENMDDNSLKNVLTRDADGGDCRLRINVGPGLRINMNVEFTKRLAIWESVENNYDWCYTPKRPLYHIYRVDPIRVGPPNPPQSSLKLKTLFYAPYFKIRFIYPPYSSQSWAPCRCNSDCTVCLSCLCSAYITGYSMIITIIILIVIIIGDCNTSVDTALTLPHNHHVHLIIFSPKVNNWKRRKERSESTSTYMLLFDGTTCLTEGHLLNQNHKVHIGKSAGGEINILTNAAFIIRYGEISATEPTVNHFELEACTRSSEEEEGAEINETADANSLRLNEFCVYSYKAPRGFKAELSFTSMNLFPESGELHNFLDITGGPYCGVESIDRVGQWPYKKVVSRGPKLCVMLVTDCCHADPWTVTGVFKSSYYSKSNGLAHKISFVNHFRSHDQNVEDVKIPELSLVRPLMQKHYPSRK
ncbi:hypothetical protein CLF_105406, partial [Clonorchis sinensis]